MFFLLIFVVNYKIFPKKDFHENEMRIPQIRDPKLQAIDQLPESYKIKIALIGCGPVSISCASSRLIEFDHF